MLRNYEGVITTYTQPADLTPDNNNVSEYDSDERYRTKEGIAGLLNGAHTVLEPQVLRRHTRNKHH